jgi:type IV pilus biogenesis protein CpaD/CtpE
MAKVPLALAFGSLLLASCNSDEPSSAETFGEAVRHNMAAQIIDPDPADLTLPPGDGERTALMSRRYQTDKVTKPAETLVGPGAFGSPAAQ